MPPFDRIIVSANEDPLYLDFWPIVAWAYRALFPGTLCELVFLTERREDDPFVAKLREHGTATLQAPISQLPQAAQAKLARYWRAMLYDDVSYVDDVDLLPMRRDWIEAKTKDRPKDHLLLVGAEVYNTGQVPASQMTAEGHVWRALFNPENHGWRGWLESLKGHPGHANIESRSYHEGYSYSTDQAELNQPLFSDEALIHRLLQARPVPVHRQTRGIQVGHDTIDRHGWNIDLDRLWKDHYVFAHLIRPYRTHRDSIAKVLSFLQHQHGVDPWPTWAPMDHAPHRTPDQWFSGSGMTIEAYDWICQHIPTHSLILELGAGEISTQWLSRHYQVYSIEQDLRWVNLYPARYIYAPLQANGWYDPKVVEGWVEDARKRGWRYGMVLVDGPWKGDRRKILEHLDWFDLTVPWMIDDTERPEERELAAAVSAKTGRPVQDFGQFSLV